MQSVEVLLERLDLERLDLNLFRGYTPNDGRPRIFGGLVAGQSVIAACRTVEDRIAHSLHAYFLREGDPTVPVIYEVDRIRDGRSFATRRVVAIQHGKAIFNMSVSFQAKEEGLEHCLPMPDTPPPEGIPSNAERYEKYRKTLKHPVFEFMLVADRPFEHRDVEPIDLANPKPFKQPHRLWFRTRGDVPDNLPIHQGLLAYASDIGLLDSCINYHGETFLTEKLMIASLDHTLWFHRPFRADEWLLYVTESPAAYSGRGLNMGRIYTQEGVLVASVAQEALMRIRKPKKKS